MSSITRNTLYNLAGSGVPLILFVVTIPVYIALIGAERYGVLAIVWLVLGVFGLMDMGLGRAVTQRIANLREAGAGEHRAVLGTALATNLLIGSVGAVLMYGAGQAVFGQGITLEPDLRGEALSVVVLMAIGVPVVTTYAILLGALQGIEKFAITNRIAIINSTIFQCLPIAIAYFYSINLFPLVAAALAARVIAVIMLWRECRRAFGSGIVSAWDRERIRPLLAFGGWVTLTMLLGTVLVFSDRLIIGSLIGAVAVTLYAVPFDASRRLGVVSEALASALFPRLAAVDDVRSRELVSRANAVLFAVATPLVAGLITVADPLMRLWLGEDIGSQSAPLLQILALAAWANIFARSPYARLQATGRPHVVALIGLIQTPFYLVALIFALDQFGLAGAAAVYLARNSADYMMLAIAAGMIEDRFMVLFSTFTAILALIVALQLAEPLTLLSGIVCGAAVALAASVLAWFVLPADVRTLIRRFGLEKSRN